MSKYLALRLEVEKQKSLPGNYAYLQFHLHRSTCNSVTSWIWQISCSSNSVCLLMLLLGITQLCC